MSQTPPWRIAVAPICLALALAACQPEAGQGARPAATAESPGDSAEDSPAPLDASTQKALADYGLSVLDAHFSDSDANAPSLPEGFKYEKVFVTLYVDGRIRGCQSGSSGDLAPDVAKAVVKTIKDKRFGGPMNAEEAPRAEINLTFLTDKRQAKAGELRYEPGVHAVEVRQGKRRAFFKAEVPITKNYTRAKTLARLCRKAKLGKDCQNDPKTKVFTYKTLTFHQARGEAPTQLVRGNPAQDPTLDQALLEARLKLAMGWFKASVNPETGRGQYQYFPSPDRYDDDNNHVRQMGTLWAITELRGRLKDDDPKIAALIKATLDHYLTQDLVEREGYAFFSVEGKAKLAFNAFAILALLHTPDYPDADALMAKLARGILHQQQDDGSYATYFESDRNSGVEFYPGESMLALMRLHAKTQEKDYLDSVKRAFPHYRDYWRGKKNTPMLSWHSQTYRLLYEATGDKEVAEHTFEMNDWLIEAHQVTSTPYPDFMGGFSRKGHPNISSATYLEGLLDATAVAQAAGDEARASRYEEAARRAMAFVLRLQFTDANSFYLKAPDKALGGFRHALTKNNLRNDNTQHAAMAMMKAERVLFKSR